MENHQEIGFTLVSLVLLGLILFCGCLSIWHGYKTILFFRALRRRGQSVRGKVVEIREDRDLSENEVSLYPIVSYSFNGQQYQVESDRFLFQPFTVGQEITLRFLPEQPAKCTWRKTGMSGIAWMLFGLAIVLLSCLGLLQVTQLLYVQAFY
ncbi:DUF3592 domain-containing protein [Larkinella bovis]|uniref:DUF3592 domain-containing protein n=1 Tax=Larkinella bovis TaxID=683041 RepID=A0ABW0I839_9BACT